MQIQNAAQVQRVVLTMLRQLLHVDSCPTYLTGRINHAAYQIQHETFTHQAFRGLCRDAQHSARHALVADGHSDRYDVCTWCCIGTGRTMCLKTFDDGIMKGPHCTQDRWCTTIDYSDGFIVSTQCSRGSAKQTHAPGRMCLQAEQHTVTSLSLSTGQSLKAPPDAVRMMRLNPPSGSP